MRGKINWTYIIFGLIIIGVISMISNNPAAYIIPLTIFAVVFLLYKFPPGRRGQQAPKSKKAKFRVIKGSKSDEPDEKPPLH